MPHSQDLWKTTLWMSPGISPVKNKYIYIHIQVIVFKPAIVLMIYPFELLWYYVIIDDIDKHVTIEVNIVFIEICAGKSPYIA